MCAWCTAAEISDRERGGESHIAVDVALFCSLPVMQCSAAFLLAVLHWMTVLEICPYDYRFVIVPDAKKTAWLSHGHWYLINSCISIIVNVMASLLINVGFQVDTYENVLTGSIHNCLV